MRKLTASANALHSMRSVTRLISGPSGRIFAIFSNGEVHEVNLDTGSFVFSYALISDEVSSVGLNFFICSVNFNKYATVICFRHNLMRHMRPPYGAMSMILRLMSFGRLP